jgi:undecaprenyl-diphosphatase
MERQRRAASWLAIASLGASVLNVLLKSVFARERPALLDSELLPGSFSFPSGHAFLSAAIYLTAGALLTQVIAKPATRAIVLAAAVLMTVLIGLSRVYLGVHYPSDVLAGWTLGLCWAALCWAVFWNLRQR